ncbi:uncharacterized protein LOC142177367 [Nicotiana tabacum]|uniref:Uncharacterized protein LOC142177367 n=1 Tax=Nicotiana tabacum TaxID=4097 RepID=A0AC58TXK2_TOBAC
MGITVENLILHVSDSTSSDGFNEFTLDPSYPLYIHPSDSPGIQLVTVPFNGTGFVIWRSSMLTSLSAKNKLGLITGKIAQPLSDSPYFPFWERCNDMVKAWITNSLTMEISISVMCLRTAREVWLDINDRFGQSNGSKYIQLQRELSSTFQGSSDIATYFTKMRSLWDELNSAYVGPSCSCGALPKFIKDQHLFQFLSGLNESYSTAKSSIIMMLPYPSISKVYSLLQQDESQKETHPVPPGFSLDSTSFSTPSTQFQPNKQFSQRVNFDSKKPQSSSSVSCKYYKKSGHNIEKCQRLYGFPPDFKFTKNKRSTSCVQMEEPSHVPYMNYPPTAIRSPDPPVHGFGKEQYGHLMTLLQEAHISPGYPAASAPTYNSGYAYFADRKPWILDFGATNHMTHTNISSQHSTSSFSFLNNITKWLQGESGFYWFYGPSLKRPLEIGKEAHGLYFLLPDMPLPSCFVPSSVSGNACTTSVDPLPHSPSCILFSTTNKMDLVWHQRLGYMPYNRMTSIPFLSGKINSKQPCSICLMARQQRLLFSDSSIKTTAPFQLVHIDVWGPYHTITYNGFSYFLTLVDDFTKVTWTYLLSCKASAFSVLKAFTLKAKVHFHSSIQSFISDNAYELGSSNKAKQFFADHDILHQTTVPHTPQQNGVVERKHKYLLETSRALLFQ